ncbi:hypothetical protein [Halomonas denitrificans]|nr:hypothetical protein [Halomonas denitrificans]
MRTRRGLELRFILSMIPGIVLLFGIFFLMAAAVERSDSGWAVAVVVAGGLSFGLGLLLLRAVVRDWRSLQGIRRHGFAPGERPVDGQPVAVEGRLICDDPLQAPISGVACAAFFFRLSQRKLRGTGSDGGSRSVVTAAGISVRSCRLQGAAGTFPLVGLPEPDLDMRSSGDGSACAERMAALLDRVVRRAELDRVEGVEEERLAQRAGAFVPVDDWRRRFEHAPPADRVRFEEELVPIERTLTVLAVYDRDAGALAPGRGPFGRAIHAYSGTRSEVMARLADELRRFGFPAVAMVLIGTGLLAVPFLLGG